MHVHHAANKRIKRQAQNCHIHQKQAVKVDIKRVDDVRVQQIQQHPAPYQERLDRSVVDKIGCNEQRHDSDKIDDVLANRLDSPGGGFSGVDTLEKDACSTRDKHQEGIDH